MTETTTVSQDWQLDQINYAGGTSAGPRASVQLSRPDESVTAEGAGTGLVDAVCQAISEATGVQARVVAFRAYSVGPGSEALAEVELDVELPRRRAAVRASSTDVIEASARAFLAAINQHLSKTKAQR